MFQFKIQIKGITKPPVWRRVLVPDTFTFEQFHFLIQAAFGWFNSHLFQFSPQGYGSYPTITMSYCVEDEPTEDAGAIVLKDIFYVEKQTFTYIYDFGDDWNHKITLEAILPDLSEDASCIEGKGACPPEDCGGIWGYEQLKEVMSDPLNAEYEEMKEWLGLMPDEEWDANFFDIEAAKDRIKDDSILIFEKMPEFIHPEVKLFYSEGYDIDRSKLHSIMALPRETLIEDMQKMLIDSIERYDYYEMCDENNFSLHALYVLSSLRAEEALNTLFLMMSQDEERLEFWFGDLITEEFWQYLYWVGQNRLDSLKTFFFTPGIYVFVRSSISETIMQIALHQPERKQEMVGWYVDVIERLLDNIDNDEIFDSFLLECLVRDFMVIGNMDVLPLIERCIATEEIDVREVGTIDKIKKALQTEEIADIYHRTLYSNIDEFYDEWEKWETGYYANRYQPDYQPEIKPYIAPPKVGRNDPCPCGSGKKYKKCCGQNE